ncbi:hypothetical protein Nepgr_007873 [Nepenthes gracilis]|uniref:Uncharacterized protein n=1 Tax=Nepenthes gracilis TaxID=150966 RepID=A0AAD3S7N3_NEPGR|nr:hypothetical protein Nepgr_007873 [Nepenthes gracilis]
MVNASSIGLGTETSLHTPKSVDDKLSRESEIVSCELGSLVKSTLCLGISDSIEDWICTDLGRFKRSMAIMEPKPGLRMLPGDGGTDRALAFFFLAVEIVVDYPWKPKHHGNGRPVNQKSTYKSTAAHQAVTSAEPIASNAIIKVPMDSIPISPKAEGEFLVNSAPAFEMSGGLEDHSLVSAMKLSP